MTKDDYLETLDEAIEIAEHKNPWPSSFIPNPERSIGRAQKLIEMHEARDVERDSITTERKRAA